MQCEIRGMADVAEAATSSADTLPKPGRVNEVCREWLVKEDGALAVRLQNEECNIMSLRNSQDRSAAIQTRFLGS
uniref:Coiled-coil domain-containing protein n=1 Tax=Timema shepardi TaxID=629360 RepID=A0A7R9AUM9_TIMSH|nr:unnamed protein product [Timema shepardi]